MSASLLHARVVTDGWIDQLEEHQRTFSNILKLSSHHAVNTENKGGKDKVCFGGGEEGGRRPLNSFEQQRILRGRSGAVRPTTLLFVLCCGWSQREGWGWWGGGSTEVLWQLRRAEVSSNPTLRRALKRAVSDRRPAPTSHLLYRKDATRHLGSFCSFFRASLSSSYLQSLSSAFLSE